MLKLMGRQMRAMYHSSAVVRQYKCQLKGLISTERAQLAATKLRSMSSPPTSPKPIAEIFLIDASLFTIR